MILTNRLFERNPPSRNAKSIYIFCEGRRREYDYFKFFKEIDSRIKIEVHQIESHDNNSPAGLLEIAINSICSTKENQFNPKYTFFEGDEVWIVLDTDPDKENTRINQIQKVKAKCSEELNWFVAESNPCFEVWLYYHEKNTLPNSPSSVCKCWKSLVSQVISGGFDSRRHPILIEEAIINAKSAYQNNNSFLDSGHTEVYRLGESITAILAEKLRMIKNKLFR